jgi:hypothetical protein
MRLNKAAYDSMETAFLEQALQVRLALSSKEHPGYIKISYLEMHAFLNFLPFEDFSGPH